MASKEHLKILKQGVKAWNEWRRVDMNARPDLSGHDFKGVDLTYINWMVTDLSGANLSGCNLKQAYMTHANLQGADLREVPAGEYLVVCAPMKLVGAEGAPTRAFLIEGR